MKRDPAQDDALTGSGISTGDQVRRFLSANAACLQSVDVVFTESDRCHDRGLSTSRLFMKIEETGASECLSRGTEHAAVEGDFGNEHKKSRICASNEIGSLSCQAW
jgi:hypothetical protein